MEDVLSLEQEIDVKLVEIDRMGRLNLSYVAAIDPDGETAQSSSHRDGGSHDGRRDDRRPPRRRD